MKSQAPQNAEKVSITMTPDMLRLIQQTVENGEYASTSEVVRDAIRMWQREREEFAAHLEAVRTRVQRSQSDPRPSLTQEQAEEELERFFHAQGKASEK